MITLADEISMVKIKAKQKLNFGKARDGHLYYIAKGETKVVPLTELVDLYAQHGMLEIIEETKPENYTVKDNELPQKKENVKSGGKKK